jgi:hypothetical protein
MAIDAIKMCRFAEWQAVYRCSADSVTGETSAGGYSTRRGTPLSASRATSPPSRAIKFPFALGQFAPSAPAWRGDKLAHCALAHETRHQCVQIGERRRAQQRVDHVGDRPAAVYWLLFGHSPAIHCR